MRLVGVGLALVLAGLTFSTTGRWQSDQALWCDALARTPDQVRPLNNCALALMHAGNYADALPLLVKASVLVEHREPNRRASLRQTIWGNEFVVLMALRQTNAARLVLDQLDPADPRTGRFRAWLAF